MALEFSTAGISIKYCVAAATGTTKPTSGYTEIPNIKGIPDTLNPEPGTIQVTDLSDLEWHRFIPALKSMGGSLALTANYTQAFKTAWTTLKSAADAAFASDKLTWFEIVVPKMNASFYFAGMPSELGFPGAEVDEAFGGSVYITPNLITGWGASSTVTSG